MNQLEEGRAVTGETALEKLQQWKLSLLEKEAFWSTYTSQPDIVSC